MRLTKRAFEAFKRSLEVPLWRVFERFFTVDRVGGIALIDIRLLGPADREEFRALVRGALNRIDGAGMEFRELVYGELRFIAATLWPRDQILARARGYGTPRVGHASENAHTLALWLVWTACYLRLCRAQFGGRLPRKFSGPAEDEIRRACYEKQLAFLEHFGDYEHWERFIESVRKRRMGRVE